MINQLLKANDPYELEAQVRKLLDQGWDVQGTLVTSDTTLLGQWMLEIAPNSDYKLVVADDIIELESTCKTLMDDGWRFWYSDQRWGGKILQWMERPVMVVSHRAYADAKRMVVHSEHVTPVNYRTLFGGARIPSILEG